MDFLSIGYERAAEIAELALALTREICERSGATHFDIDPASTHRLCQQLLADGRYTVVAALEADQVVGFASLAESISLYADGGIGIVQEFYVLPAWRSHAVGAGIIEQLVEIAAARGWRRLELCTPPVPAFDRTVAFYQANGFEVTGGYKMKRLVS